MRLQLLSSRLLLFGAPDTQKDKTSRCESGARQHLRKQIENLDAHLTQSNTFTCHINKILKHYTNSLTQMGKQRHNHKQHDKHMKIKKRKREDHPDHSHLFPLILASLANLHRPSAQSLLTKSLQTLQTSSPSLVTGAAVLALLPSLLGGATAAVAQIAAEIAGAAAIFSLEANEAVSADEEILVALMEAVEGRSERVAVAACNAVLDLCASSVARRRLCEVFAVEKIMSVFLRRAASPLNYASQHCMRKGNLIGCGEKMEGVGFYALVIDAAVTLVNTCNAEQLQRIPRNLSVDFLNYLKDLWKQKRDDDVQKNMRPCCQGQDCASNNLKMHDLSESIFRLSLFLGTDTVYSPNGVEETRMFGPNESDTEHFMSEYWENLPVLLKRNSKPIWDDYSIFTDLFNSFISKQETLDELLYSIFIGLVSCPPLPSDELDILQFLKEVRDDLGSSICYGQDIRIVKTEDTISGGSQRHLKREVHFLSEYAGSSSSSDLDHLSNVNAHIFKEAVVKGYTIALRGMEFRSEIIAAIADRLAVMFGQPSVGVNLYLTPPNSQGLARHYDDRCVFLCQLLGQKHWRVFPRQTLLLPRLYEPCDSFLGYGSTDVESRCMRFLLDKGDILYIPRGCPHEACTSADDVEFQRDDKLKGFSLHLTFGIEVEPPFEWEGFVHVALSHWSKNQIQQPFSTSAGSMCSQLIAMSTNLLHIEIQMIGCNDPVFRKACMIAGISLPSLDCTKRNTFRHVIDKIDKEACFTNSLKFIEGAIQSENEDHFQRMRWLRHIHDETNSQHLVDWSNPLIGFKSLWQMSDEHRDDLEDAFTLTKSRFCKDVLFENVCKNYSILLQKYTITRKQYMSGMLSLHCT
ncbi:hypothetical protein Sjap_022923 [Stephania japonica]|uniref:Bifunctional lysine-specific demethylase and histidyl-hydroxylase n=1 Tax=Stephania japonica TaxID=461633 RepID=A0AAP0HUU8_9MAGN